MNDLTTNFRQQLQEAMQDHANSYLRIGSLLSAFKKSEGWKEGYKNFADWVTGETEFSRAWAYNAIAIAERFGDKALGVQPSRLQALLPVEIENEEDQSQLLESAKTLNGGAFHDLVLERKGKVTTDSCEHSTLGSYCINCGKRM